MLIRTLVLAPARELRRLRRLVPREFVTLCPVGHASVLQALADEDFDLLLIDRKRIPGDPGALCERLRALSRAPEAIVLCEHADPIERASMLTAGCLAVVEYELNDAVLAETLLTLVSRRREALHRERSPANERSNGLRDFVSRSSAMDSLLTVARKIVESDVSLLVLGETGVGKERFAHAMHDEGPRRGGPFIAVNCGAIPEHLMESELFGHEKGAFTGAETARRGYFELAHGGTLFLDEVAEITPSLQVKLLRALQERRIRRLGAERETAVDVRLIAATNRDLPSEVEARRFRADLYYRIAVVTVTVPPLRARREDIPALVEAHAEALGARFRKHALQIEPDVLKLLMEYDWPGNVRELVNVLERAILLCDGDRLTVGDLPDLMARRRQPPAQPVAVGLADLPYHAAVDRAMLSFDLAYFTRLLQESHGRIGVAARRAGITPRTLYAKMTRLGLHKEQFRADPAEPDARDANVESGGSRAGEMLMPAWVAPVDPACSS